MFVLVCVAMVAGMRQQVQPGDHGAPVPPGPIGVDPARYGRIAFMVWSNTRSVAVTLAFALLRATAPAAAADDLGGAVSITESGDEIAARELIETFHLQLVALASGPDQDLAARLRGLTPIVVASHDFPYIARFTMRRQWEALTTEQRTAFITAFSELSVMTYATRFAGVTQDTFTIRGVSAAGRGRIQVEALINRPEATPITLNYLLQPGDAGLRIINIIADGVSDLALKRAEYQRVFAETGFAGLLGHIQQLTADMAHSP
jgi:phospholipid transport system substrate-binding protein